MEYILTQSEYDALTPVKRLQDRNEALEVARKIIVKLTGKDCKSGYCDHCPISDIGHNKNGTHVLEESIGIPEGFPKQYRCQSCDQHGSIERFKS